VKLISVDEKIGFWSTCGFIDLDKGNVWPREYRWKCGCIGVSPDGDIVRMAPCDGHLESFDLPDWVDAEQIRRAALQRETIGEKRELHIPAGDGMRAYDRRVFLEVFNRRTNERRERRERSRDKR